MSEKTVSHKGIPRIVKIAGKTLLWLIAGPLILLTLLILLLQLPGVQRFVTNKATAYVSEKTGATVRLGKLSIAFPKAIAIEQLYVEDLGHDTLLYLGNLEVDIALLDLLDHRVTVNKVALDSLTARVSRTATDSSFNFSFIINAFNKPKSVSTAPDDRDTTSGAWEIRLHTINLQHINATYHDAYAGSFADLRLDKLEVDVKTLDLSGKRIDVERVALSDTYASYVQKASAEKPKETSTSTPFDYDLRLGSLDLKGITALYQNTLQDQKAAVSLGHLELKPEKIDLLHERIDIASLLLKNTTANYSMGPAAVTDTLKVEQDTLKAGTATTSNWIVTAGRIDLDSNHFYYDNNRVPRSAKGIDYNHIAANHFALHATEVYGNAKTSHLHLDQLSFDEQCGFGIREFRGDIVFDTVHAELSNLYLATKESVIRDHLSAHYRSLQEIGNEIGNLYVSAQLKDTEIKGKDILYFAPMLSDIEAVKISPDRGLRMNLDLKGRINDLTFDKFELFTPKNTIVKLKGKLKDVLDPKRMYLDLQNLHLTSTKNDLLGLLSPTIIPSSVTLPETFAITGNVKGYLNNFNTHLRVQTSLGNLLADIRMNPAAGNTSQPYEGTVRTEHLNLGKLLKQEATLGELSTELHVKGSGLSPKDVDAQVSLAVEKAHIKGYSYTNLKVDGQLLKRSFTGKAVMDDPNLAFDFEGALNFDSAAPRYAFTFDLKGADLKALQLSPEDMRVSTYIRSNLQQQDDNLTGTAGIYNTLIIKNKRRIPLDSVILKSETENGVTQVRLQSDIAEAGLKGTLHMTELGASLAAFINTYYTISDAPARRNLKDQDFDFYVNVSNARFISENFVPALEEMSPLALSGNYRSRERKLSADLSLSHIRYSGTKADSLRLIVNADPSALKFALNTAEVSNPTIKVENASLGGQASNNQLSFALATAKDDSVKLLALGGTLKKIAAGHELKLDPELVLNAQTWTVSRENYLQFTPQGLFASAMNLSHNAQAVNVNSMGNTPEAPLQLDFVKFDLATISRMLENKTELLKGEMNGMVRLEKRGASSAFSSDLVISDFVFQSVPIGTVKLKAANRNDANSYDINMQLSGNGNELQANGTYNVANRAQALNFTLDIASLQLKTIEPFTFGQVTRLSGSASGKLNIRGSANAPEIDGNLDFKETALNPKFIDSYLKIPEGRLSFADRKLILQNFTILDSLDNKAALDGSVSLKDLQNPDLNLKLHSENFLALNTTKQDNPLYFGTIFLDSDINVRGTVNSPSVKARIRLNKGSELTYIKPESQVGKAENKGIVEFVDSLNTRRNIMTRQNDTLEQVTMMKGIDLDASITFDKSVQLKMLVDQQSGDSLYIVGGGTLNFVLDQSGKTTLTGKYRIDDGGYHLTISEVVKRDFRIEPGSSVTWSGDLLDAYVDIKAIYTIKTSPIDLIQNDLAGVDELERNKYRNMLTFLVYLKMNGFLSAPEISFDIQLAPKDKGAVNGTVNAKLEELRGDETQLNKQVFALLTLRRFISDNPLDNGGGGGGLSSASRTSASKILTQQLSSLSQKYIKGIDLDLGVNSFEDYSTGQEQGRTQLQIGVSKQLFKDKVTIRVGGNVELEGERAKQNNASDVAGNISIDYKLTDDGRYKLRGFRQNQYENPIEGEITKTGVGVVYVRNYNRLKELFKKPKQAAKSPTQKTK